MIVGFIYLFFISNDKDKLSYEQVFNVNNNEKIIEVNEDFYKISVKYPETNYKKLNSKIERFVEREIDSFYDFIKNEKNEEDRQYQLIIGYDTYITDNYISYVFHIFIDFAGAHPSTQIHTITYNKSRDDVVNIETLITYNSNILDIFSKESRRQLLKNKNIVDTNMMMEGTRPLKKNFSNFAFSKNGIILFFESYQVASYSAGEFQVLVDYDHLKSEGVSI